jgi:cell division protease FtsH
MEPKKTKSKRKEFRSKFSKNKMNPFYLALFGIVVWSLLSVIFTSNNLSLSGTPRKEIPLNELFNLIQKSEVKKIVIDGSTVNTTLKDGTELKSQKEPEISLYELLTLKNIDPNLVVEGIQTKTSYAWLDIVANIAFPLITLGFLFWIFRQAGKSAGGVFNLGKSRAKLFMKDAQNKMGFENVAGVNEVKKELFEIVDFLKNPEKYRKLGARIPRGVLLIGPSGVGKTLLARAIAGEANVPFYSVAGSEFIEMIVGVGSARVRDLFTVAKQTSPSLIFIDEIDAIGRHRGKGIMGGNDEREQTLNQILVEMDGFDQRTNVIIIAATNRPDMLDSALVRPGRFDRQIRIELPDVKEREDIIKIHMIGKPFEDDVTPDRISRMTTGFSGADIENMLNEAAILAARHDHDKISKKDIVNASSRVKLGPERRILQTEEERKMTAYHEAGHAIIANKTDKTVPVNRISIISRSASLGHTEYMAEGNMYNLTKPQLLSRIRMMLGGRAAEEIEYNELSVGAAGDIEQATYLAKKMVTDFGMSPLGPVNLVHANEGMWEGVMPNKAYGYSEEMAKKIDNEVSRIINTELTNAKNILKKHKKLLDKLALALLEKETIEQDEFEKIIEDDTAESQLPMAKETGTTA